MSNNLFVIGEVELKLTISIQEYLEIEQNLNEKYENLAGEIFAVGGRTLNHSLISSNFIRSVSNSIIKKGELVELTEEIPRCLVGRRLSLRIYFCDLRKNRGLFREFPCGKKFDFDCKSFIVNYQVL